MGCWPAVMRKLPAGLFAQFAEGGELRLDVVQSRAERAQQPLARLGGRHAARGAGRAGEAEPRLQTAQRVAQRGLRDPEPGRRPGETAFLGDGEEGVDAMEIVRGAFMNSNMTAMPSIPSNRAKRRAVKSRPRRPRRHETGDVPWISNAAVRRPPARAPRTGSPARCASTPCSRRRPGPRRPATQVTFEPGARTAWHTHPLGQILIVTAGCGRVQREGGPIEEIRPGDVVWFEPGEKHWHGAAPTTAMTHIAIQESLDGKAVDWMEQVTDAQYAERRRLSLQEHDMQKRKLGST